MAQQHPPNEETPPEQQQKQHRQKALRAGTTKRPMPARLALAAGLGTLLAVLVWGVLPDQPRAQGSHLDSRLHTTVETPLTHSELNTYNDDVNIVITSSELPPIPPVPVVPQPVPVIPHPTPVVPQPVPVIPHPTPVVPEPIPVVPQPVPVVPEPIPVVPQPTPVIPHPHVFPHPTPVVPQPVPVVPEPIPVVPHPTPVIPQPVVPLEQVPNLIGHDLATAEQLLAQKGLRVGTIIHQGSGEPTGTVLQTNPGPNAVVPSGSVVDLFVAG